MIIDERERLHEEGILDVEHDSENEAYVNWRCGEYMKDNMETKGMNIRYESLTPQEKRKLVDEEEHVCQICGRQKFLLEVDHNHQSGMVRGVLCGRCNKKVRQNDSEEILAELVKRTAEGERIL